MSTHSKKKKEMNEGGLKTTTTFQNITTKIKGTTGKLIKKAANASPEMQTLNLYDAEMARRNK